MNINAHVFIAIEMQPSVNAQCYHWWVGGWVGGGNNINSTLSVAI